MTTETRRRLFWIGGALLLLPTLLLAITLFWPPREYQSSVFIEVRQSSAAPAPITDFIAMHRDTIYAVLLLMGLFLPGVGVIVTGLLGGRSQHHGSGPPHI